MKFLFNWLKDLSGYKGNALKMAELLKLHAFDVKNVDRHGKDFILDIDVLPNRSFDCFSHLGVARELAAITGKNLKEKNYEVKSFSGGSTCSVLKVSVKNPELCSRYKVCLMRGVKVRESPKWLRDKLSVCGLNSVNNVVDAANYAMLLAGHPLHIFDFDKLTNGEMEVRTAKKGEKITVLSGETVELDSSALLIADSKNILALAGIKGGKIAEVDKHTKNIVIEAAVFDSQNIRKTSVKLGIKTDASIRFEHGVSDWTLEYSMDAAMAAINDVAGGVLHNKYDIDYHKHYHRKVSFSLEFLEKFIGEKLEEKEVRGILERLGFKVSAANIQKILLAKAQSLLDKPYKYGASTYYDAPDFFDCSSFTRYVFREAGIEIPRLSIKQFDFAERVGLEELKAGDLVFSRGERPHTTKKHPEGIGHVGLYVGKDMVVHASGNEKKKKTVKENLGVFVKNNWRGAGRIDDVFENRFIAFVPSFRRDILTKEDIAEEIVRIKGYNNLKSTMPTGVLQIKNSDDGMAVESKLRNMFFHLGYSEAYNYSFIGKKDAKNFSLAERNILALKNPASEDFAYMRPNLFVLFAANVAGNARFFDTIRIFELGKIYRKTDAGIEERKKAGFVIFNKRKEKINAELFFEAKGAVEAVLDGLGVNEREFLEGEDIDAVWSAKKFTEIYSSQKKLGTFGYIKQEILKKYGIDFPVVACEFDQETVVNLCKKEFEYTPLSKYPAVIRDLSILTDLTVKTDEVFNVIENAGGELLFDADIFDIYDNAGDDNDAKKSMSFHLLFQAKNRTLTDREAGRLMDKIVKAAEESGWEVKK